MSTHKVCFGSKIRKLGIPLQTPVFLYKSEVEGGYTFHGNVILKVTFELSTNSPFIWSSDIVFIFRYMCVVLFSSKRSLLAESWNIIELRYHICCI